MAVYNDEKLKAMEDEMNRFEEEIGLPILPPPPPPPMSAMNTPAVIGANTYNTVQRQLEEQQQVGPVISAVAMPAFPAVVGIPPPPPPPPMLVPHQVRMRPPIRHSVRPVGPSGPVMGPGPGFIPPGQGGPSYMGPPGMGSPGMGSPGMGSPGMGSPGMGSPGMGSPGMGPPGMGSPGMMPLQPMPSVVSATPLMYPTQVSEPHVPIGVMDQSVIVSTELPNIAPLNMPAEPSIPVIPVDPNIDRVNKIKPRNHGRPPTINHTVPLPPIIPQAPPTPMEETSTSKKKKNKKLIRTAGGQTWEDPSLAEWEDDDFRLFCGDLGNDVTDEILTRVFSKYSSFLKAKVVRDKRTNKTKGFGFVSFKDPQDFIKAMKEMNGRYVGSRPIKLRKSSWKNRSLDTVRKKEKEKAALIGLLTGR